MVVARKQLCGHVVSPATREHAVIEETLTVRSVSGLCNACMKEDLYILQKEEFSVTCYMCEMYT
jgi:hypothetical protein